MLKKLLTLMVLISSTTFGNELTFFYTNDMHAHVNPYIFKSIDENRKVGGFANLYTAVKEGREAVGYDKSLFLDAGDYYTGPSISTLTEGEAIIDILNSMDLDAAAIGNHETDHGVLSARRTLSMADFTLLNNNIYFDSGEKFIGQDFKIIEKNGIKVGIIGTHGKFAFVDTTAARMTKGIHAEDEYKHTQRNIDEIRDFVDVVVVLAHQGTPARQSSSGASDVKRALNKDIEMAKTLKGVDIIITGHAHQVTPEPIVENGVVIVSTSAQASMVGNLKIDVNKDTKKVKVVDHKNIIVYSDKFKADPTVQKKVDKWNAVVDEITRKKISYTDVDLNRAYGEESTLGNLAADIIYWSGKRNSGMDIDFAVTNSGGIRAEIAKGDITYGDIIAAFPFPNALSVVKLKGSDVTKIFEHAATVSNGVLQSSEQVRMTYNKETGKLISLTINGKKVDPNKEYTVASSDFLTNGGDGFLSFNNATFRKDWPDYFISEMFLDYLKENKGKDLDVKLDGRVKPVK